VKITDHVKFSKFPVEDQEDRVQLGYLLDTKPIIKFKIIEEISKRNLKKLLIFHFPRKKSEHKWSHIVQYIKHFHYLSIII